MTDAQKNIVLFLADIYLRLGRPKRSLMLLVPVARIDPDNVRLCRLALRGFLAVQNYERALELVERLVEHEFSSQELAFALSMQSRALAGLERIDAAQAAWKECVSLCRVSGLDIMEFAK